MSKHRIPTNERFVLKHPNGTYYQKHVAIGPMFGGTLDQAMRFNSKEEAAPLFADWRVEGKLVPIME